jgi:MFS family permease
MATMSEVAGGRFLARLHWGAVIAGVFLAIAAHIVLGLVGAAIGLAAVPADTQAVGAGAAIWALLTPFVATALGAWLAIRLTGEEDRAAGYVHGVLVWCIGLIAGAIFLTGTLASGAMTAGFAASGNLATAQRVVGTEPGQPATAAEAQARAEDAGATAAAAAGGAALAAIAGLLGAMVGAGLAMQRGRQGRGLGWRIAIQRKQAATAGTPEAGRTVYGPEKRGPAAGEPPRSEPGAPPSDPYHH